MGTDGRRRGESVIWAPPIAHPPSPTGYRGGGELPGGL